MSRRPPSVEGGEADPSPLDDLEKLLAMVSSICLLAGWTKAAGVGSLLALLCWSRGPVRRLHARLWSWARGHHSRN